MPPRARAIAGVLAFAATAALDAPDSQPDAVGVLVFTRTAGFRHDSIPAGIAAIRALGAEHGWRVVATEDAGAFTKNGLSPFDVVVFLSTTGDVLNDVQQAAFERYIAGGGGYVGVHAAADTEYDWPWYGKLVGAYFAGHPAIQTADVQLTDTEHACVHNLPDPWTRRDEWYNFRDVQPGLTVLAEVDESSYEGGAMGESHPIAWCHEFEGGRSFYTAMGHTSESYSEPAFIEHLHLGIKWVAGHAD